MKKYQRQNGACFAGAMVCILISIAFAVVLQFFKGDVLDHALSGASAEALRYAVLLFACILGEVLFYFIYKRLTARFVVGCTKLLKRDIFESILRRGYVSYKQLSQGEYIAKYTNEADMIQARRFQMLPLFWEILFRIVFVSAALFLLDWRIALVTIGLLTTPLYIPKLIEKRLQRAQAEYVQAVEAALSRITDWLNGFEIIKNYSVEKAILRQFDEVNDLAMDKLLQDTTLGAVSQLITTLISYLSYFVVLAVAAWLVLKGDFTAGNFFVAIGMIDQLSYPLISLAEIIRKLVSVRPSCHAMERFIKEGSGPSESKRLSELRSGIRYDGVSFAYPNAQPILKDLDFEVKKGKRYLIQGPSGCGKTTAVNLLLRYYDVTGGSIEIDGTPLSAYDSTYDCMTVVRQEAVLFHDSLRNNLTMYREIADEKLVHVLSDLGLGKYATAQALDETVSENGANLSGGDKKRICLARALLRDTDVLILDEPLANLDEATAQKIEDLLLSIEGRTMLVVSHQFSERKLSRFDGVLSF